MFWYHHQYQTGEIAQRLSAGAARVSFATKALNQALINRLSNQYCFASPGVYFRRFVATRNCGGAASMLTLVAWLRKTSKRIDAQN